MFYNRDWQAQFTFDSNNREEGFILCALWFENIYDDTIHDLILLQSWQECQTITLRMHNMGNACMHISVSSFIFHFSFYNITILNLIMCIAFLSMCKDVLFLF